MTIEILIGIICTILGAAITYATFLHNQKRTSRTDGQELGTILTEIGYIKANTDEIKLEQREQREKNTEFTTRLTALEASSTQAHRRLDLMEGREPRD